MKIYETTVTTQNFGSRILVILRGDEQDINETFNSFYNWCGADGSLDINSYPFGAIGVFWTNERNLRRYWQNRFLLLNPQVQDVGVYESRNDDANLFVHMNYKEMRDNSENFINFNKNYASDEHSIGDQKTHSVSHS